MAVRLKSLLMFASDSALSLLYFDYSYVFSSFFPDIHHTLLYEPTTMAFLIPVIPRISSTHDHCSPLTPLVPLGL